MKKGTKKVILITFLLLTAIMFSGCVEEKDDGSLDDTGISDETGDISDTGDDGGDMDDTDHSAGDGDDTDHLDDGYDSDGDGVDDGLDEYVDDDVGNGVDDGILENDSEIISEYPDLEVKEYTALVQYFKYAQKPPEIIKKGSRVIWLNRQDSSKIFTLVSDDGLFEDQRIIYGRRYAYTFNETGQFNFSGQISSKKIYLNLTVVE